MRCLTVCAALASTILARPALAADHLLFGPAASWIVPQTAPRAPAKPSNAPVSLLLSDRQIRLEPGRTTTYSEVALKIQKPEGLAAGNLSLTWNPATDKITVHKVEIHRGDKVIDVLASGQTFTTMRRETNLELATLDGQLTANLQPEDLQEGDIIVLSSTLEHADPTLKSHVEAGFGMWNELPIALAHARLQWPASLPLTLRESGGLEPVSPVVHDGLRTVEIVARNVEPQVAPKEAPVRFAIGRLGEASDFSTWADAAALLSPLFESASAIPAAGPLREELNKIRAASTDPKTRAEAALSLVQKRVRYVALLMGVGGYQPASAEETWSRRFGDCKAKTALLIGLLHELGIKADPVIVRSQGGDMLTDRLPIIAWFDHVLARAELGGKLYWLDGTRSGDTELDMIDVPEFRWGLPLVANAKLVPIMPPPLTLPGDDTNVTIDASAGIKANTKLTVNQTFRGDAAIGMNNSLSGLTDAQRGSFFDVYWKRNYDFVTPGVTATTFDPAKKEYRMSMSGDAKLDWNDGYFHLPGSSVGYSPNFDRPAGPLHNAPVAVDYPVYSRTKTVLKLPPGFFGLREMNESPKVDQVLAGVAYRVAATKSSTAAADVVTVETSTRSLAPEIQYQDALAAVSRLKQLDDQDISVPLPTSYRPTKADLAAMLAVEPANGKEYSERAQALLSAGKMEAAIADYNHLIKADPKDAASLVRRAFAEMSTKDSTGAAKDVAAALALKPENVEARVMRATLELSDGDYAKAATDLAAVLKAHPENPTALAALAQANHGLGKDNLALEESIAALKLEPDLMDMRMLRANIFVEQGDLAGVAKEAALLTTENPNAAFAYVGAGKILARLGKSTEALAALDRAIALSPEAYVYVNRADVRPADDHQGRIADYDAALKLEPDMPEALSHKAEEYVRSGNFSAALPLYDRAIAKNPKDLDALTGRTVALSKAGRSVESKQALINERAAASNANDYNNICWARATAGEMLDEALSDCQHALRLQPDAPSYLDSLGLVELRLGRLGEAIATYTKAIAGNAGASSLMGRAIAFERSGQADKAAVDRAQARKLNANIEQRFAGYGLELHH